MLFCCALWRSVGAPNNCQSPVAEPNPQLCALYRSTGVCRDMLHLYSFGTTQRLLQVE